MKEVFLSTKVEHTDEKLFGQKNIDTCFFNSTPEKGITVSNFTVIPFLGFIQLICIIK